MEYRLKRTSRSLHIKISLNHQGEVVVSAPKMVPKFMIDNFVNQNKSWIERQKQKLNLKKTANPNLNWEEHIISYLGKLYSIKVDDAVGQKVEFVDGACIVRPVTGLITDGKKTLITWLKHHSEEYIQNRVVYWAEVMKVEYGTVRFGQQISRWGSCSGENNLRFNWRLIHFPTEVIDYVIIHELSHTVHHDHSNFFWSLVATHCSSWKTQRAFLKRQTMTVEEI